MVYSVSRMSIYITKEVNAVSDEQLEITNNTTMHRFEVNVEGQLAILEYEVQGKTIIFPHTLVPGALRGRGIADQMAYAALEYARDNQFTVVPRCSFVQRYIQKHPEYQAMVAKE